MSAIEEKYRLINDNERAIERYRNIVFYFTFIAYANSHLSRKCYTNLKVQIRGAGVDSHLMSQMDSVFMLFYAVGSFFSGSLGDRYHAPTIVGIGLIGSGMAILFLAVGFWTNFIAMDLGASHLFFLGVWTFHGLMQSTGGPVNTVIMGNWFGPKNRGYIFGSWTCHQYVGNIVAAIIASIVLLCDISWTWALLVPSVSNIFWGFTCIFFLPEKPESVGIEMSESSSNPVRKISDRNRGETSPITLFEAISIPNVVGYSLAFGFFKLNNYALFFNLPFFLSQHFSPESANLISILYDVGMMPGGVIVGSFSDFYGGRRACVIATFMAALIVLLTFFAMMGESLPAPALLILLGIMGCLVGGPNNIITSAVAADLSEHPTIRGNARALGTVTGIINGSGSIIAALALLMIGPLQQTYGWSAVWFLLIGNTIVGTLLMSPQIYKELYYHDCPDPSVTVKNGYEAVRA